MNTAEAAREWLERHFDSLPVKTRPEKIHLSEFAHIFASYLTTSFELIKAPGTRLISPGGCYCAFCSYLGSASHLKTKKLSVKAKHSARQLKRIYLNSLAEEHELGLLNAAIDSILHDHHLSPSVSLAIYMSELIRRSKFASQGEGVLVLWREIAWHNNAPKGNYKLEAEKILHAEKLILQRMREC